MGPGLLREPPALHALSRGAWREGAGSLRARSNVKRQATRKRRGIMGKKQRAKL